MEGLTQQLEECLQCSVRSGALGAVFVLLESFLLCGFLCHFQNLSLTVENPSKGLSFYSAPCKNKCINMVLLGLKN